MFPRTITQELHRLPHPTLAGRAVDERWLLIAPGRRGGRLWRELSAKHGLTVEDFDWLVAHCRAQ